MCIKNDFVIIDPNYFDAVVSEHDCIEILTQIERADLGSNSRAGDRGHRRNPRKIVQAIWAIVPIYGGPPRNPVESGRNSQITIIIQFMIAK